MDRDAENFFARPPLGLPTGSVRAFITLLILSVLVHEVALGHQVSVIWAETFVIAMAHYFTTRRFVLLPTDVLKRLETEGVLPREARPLFLPRHSIRAVIVLTFVGLGVYLYRQNRLLDPQVMLLLGTVMSYLLGVLVNAISTWWTRGKKTRAVHFWEDLKAVAVILTMLTTTALYFLLGPERVPHGLQTFTVGMVLFYFGSR